MDSKEKKKKIGDLKKGFYSCLVIVLLVSSVSGMVLAASVVACRLWVLLLVSLHRNVTVLVSPVLSP